MDCDKVKKVSEGYLEDAVPPELRSQVADHLARCPVCAALMNQMTRFRRRIHQALCKDCCPGNLRQRLESRLHFAGLRFHLAGWLSRLRKSP